jgi:DNA polymerase I
MQVEVTKAEKISSMPPSMLVSATYDNISRSAVLKFYDPKSQKLILWLDEIGHKPYCYSKLDPDELDFLQEREDVLSIEKIKRQDLIKDEKIEVSKITVSDPLAIGGTTGEKSIRKVKKVSEM